MTHLSDLQQRMLLFLNRCGSLQIHQLQTLLTHKNPSLIRRRMNDLVSSHLVTKSKLYPTSKSPYLYTITKKAQLLYNIRPKPILPHEQNALVFHLLNQLKEYPKISKSVKTHYELDTHSSCIAIWTMPNSTPVEVLLDDSTCSLIASKRKLLQTLIRIQNHSSKTQHIVIICSNNNERLVKIVKMCEEYLHMQNFPDMLLFHTHSDQITTSLFNTPIFRNPLLPKQLFSLL